MTCSQLQQDLSNIFTYISIRNPFGITGHNNEIYSETQIKVQDLSTFQLLWRDLDPDQEPDVQHVFEFCLAVLRKKGFIVSGPGEGLIKLILGSLRSYHNETTWINK